MHLTLINNVCPYDSMIPSWAPQCLKGRDDCLLIHANEICISDGWQPLGICSSRAISGELELHGMLEASQLLVCQKL